MKIIHTADLHIDSGMEADFDRARAGERRVELLETFERMVSYAAEKDVRAILIAGDFFDKPHIRKSIKRRVLEQITGHPAIDFVYLQGNHGHCDLLSDLDENEVPGNLKMFTDDAWLSYRYGNVVITGREITGENYKTLPMNLILDQADFNIVTLHGQESNYVGHDRTQIIHLPDFKNKNIDYLALGHIHGYRSDRLDERGIYCYPGCPEGRGFGDSGSKGFVLLNIDEETKELSYDFIEFAKRRLYEVEVEISGDMNMPRIIEEIRAQIKEIRREDLLKVILTGTVAMDFEIDAERIRQVFSPEYYYFTISNRTKMRIDYDRFANDRSLKGEFVRLMQKSGMDEEERANIIELGMKAILGEEII